MDELIICSLQGTTSPEEERRLAIWRGASVAGERRFREMARIWELGAALAGSAIEEPVPTIQELMERAERQVPREPVRPPSPSRWRSPWRIGLALAATFALAFLGYRLLPSVDERAPVHWGAAEFVTGPGERVTVKLADGTLVRLAPESRLRLRDGQGVAREVWLDGRAFFAVVSEEGRPFRVRTHAGDAVVLGTRFDLQAHNGELRLLVIEGSVELETQGRKVAVGASETVEVSGSRPPALAEVDPVRVREELRWMGDFLVFEGTPLRQAARELSLHYGVPIEVLDSTLARETVHGWFADERLEDVLRVVCRAVAAHCTVRPAGITIEP